VSQKTKWFGIAKDVAEVLEIGAAAEIGSANEMPLKGPRRGNGIITEEAIVAVLQIGETPQGICGPTGHLKRCKANAEPMHHDLHLRMCHGRQFLQIWSALRLHCLF
jgi:hypothetical protein